jgi:hypothetical protein
MLALIVAAVSIGLTINGAGVGPDAISPPGLATVTIETEGHPERITIDAVTPAGEIIRIGTCFDAVGCAGDIYLGEFGLWIMVGTIEFPFLDPDGGPHVNVVGTSITIIDITAIFADGFESGDIIEWN